MTLSELCKLVQERFIHADEVVSIIELAHKTGDNALLHGPPGYGKTQIAKLMGELLYKKEETEVIALGEGTMSSNLLGGLDMKALQEEGDLLYKPERSWMSRKYVIMDEILDAVGPTLENLKYILSEGSYPQRGGQYDWSVNTIVGCTNRNPVEWAAGNESLLAVMSRFPYQMKVQWPSHTYADYSALLKKTYNHDKFAVVAECAEMCAEHHVVLSPRDVIKLAKAYGERNSVSVFALNLKVQANATCLHAILSFEGQMKKRTKIREVLTEINNRLVALPKPHKDTAVQSLADMAKLKRVIQNLVVDDKMLEETQNLKSALERAEQEYINHLPA